MYSRTSQPNCTSLQRNATFGVDLMANKKMLFIDCCFLMCQIENCICRNSMSDFAGDPFSVDLPCRKNATFWAFQIFSVSMRNIGVAFFCNHLHFFFFFFSQNPFLEVEQLYYRFLPECSKLVTTQILRL